MESAAETCVFDTSKPCLALGMMRETPEKWLRHLEVDDRDIALLNAACVPWVDYGARSYLRKMYTLEQGENLFKEVNWHVENDEHCKKIVAEAGGILVGFAFGPPAPSNWKSMKVVVNINVPLTAGLECTWGLMGTQPTKVRIFKGPSDTCENHPWDAMILRDCRPTTEGFLDTSAISSQKWDMLLMKMCEDYDYPWVVVAVNDAGPDTDPPCGCYAL
ncbi:hypothetical protein HD806DRAFT_552322 [Xylariaceae sp. AK1471]|nr:hypothetical protein HD806DRAFT_552322 [Xylariaceae sp. AK1471]